MQQGLANWHFVCHSCGLEYSTLEPKINQIDSINEIERENALRPLRDHNFNLLVQWLIELAPSNKNPKLKLLDVGSAHGWFLKKAEQQFDVLGIEPDEAVASLAANNALNIRKGYFPAVLNDQDKFDIIIFNDVLEHIPSVNNIFTECAKYLNDDGILVINAPDRGGVFYRASKLLKKLGNASSFNRMWQVGMPSPHLYYFDTNSINKIATLSGFKLVQERPLSSVVAKGLFDRINYAEGNKFINYLIGCAVLLSIPVLNAMKSDITVWFFKKQNKLS
jgi:SAM-dependent methyltransferase